MALTVSIGVSQSAISPSYVTITDNSTGSDVAVTQRRLTIQDANGVYLTGGGSVNYDTWSYSDASIVENIITQNYSIAANVLVEWLDVSNTVLYTYNENYPFPNYGKQFFVYLVQNLGLQPGTYQDSNYSGNLAVFWGNLVAGINQVEDGNDIAGAQNCFNRVIEMQQNESKYF
jgi:hypothetical protein